MIEIAMRRSGSRLLPVDDHSAEDLIRVPSDRDVLVKIVSQRNMKLLRFLWALAGKVADACEWLHDKDDAMDELKIRARHVKYIANPLTGEVRIVPKSLTKIDGAALNRLANRMVYIVCRDIVPGLDETALRAEIMEMVSGPDESSLPQSTSSSPMTAESKPAADAAPQPLAAGSHSESSGPHATDDGSEGTSATGQADAGPSLPQGWELTYAAALRRAQSKPSLEKFATQFWKQYGGWHTHKGSANGATASAIFDAFSQNFGNRDAIETALRELV